MPAPVLTDLPGSGLGGRLPVQFGGGDWTSRPQNWARGDTTLQPRPAVDPAGGGLPSPMPSTGASTGIAPGAIAAALQAGELADQLAGGGITIVNGKLGDEGGQGMSAPPGPPSSPDDWQNPFGAGAAAPTAPAKKPPASSSSSSSTPSTSTSSSAAPIALAVVLGALILLT